MFNKTEEEFETAFGCFKSKGRPIVYTFFKDCNIKLSDAKQDDLMSLWAFQKKILELGHFQTVCNNIDQLTNKFNHQLGKVKNELV